MNRRDRRNNDNDIDGASEKNTHTQKNNTSIDIYSYDRRFWVTSFIVGPQNGWLFLFEIHPVCICGLSDEAYRHNIHIQWLAHPQITKNI